MCLTVFLESGKLNKLFPFAMDTDRVELVLAVMSTEYLAKENSNDIIKRWLKTSTRGMKLISSFQMAGSQTVSMHVA